MANIIAENLLLVCSICLDSITDYKERSVAKLKCGHEFHLDCIGSAFNMKGAMVCPNCRNTEGGNWLCADGPDPSLSDSSIDYGTFAEHTYQFLVAEDQPSGHRRLPLSGLTGGHSSFEQVEFTLGFPGVRRFTSPMGFPRLAPGLHSATPPQGGSNISPHLDGQNLHEENRGHLSHFPIRLSHINSGRGSQGQASGGADPGHRSGNFWPL